MVAPPDDRSKSNQRPRARGNGVRMEAVSRRLRSYYTSHSDLMWRSGAGKPNNPTFELTPPLAFLASNRHRRRRPHCPSFIQRARRRRTCSSSALLRSCPLSPPPPSRRRLMMPARKHRRPPQLLALASHPVLPHLRRPTHSRCFPLTRLLSPCRRSMLPPRPSLRSLSHRLPALARLRLT